MLKYQHIANEIEKYIEKHALQQGDKIPSLEMLMLHFGVSKSTITRSLDLLERKGIIFQVRGSGIFVRRHKRKGYINLISNQGFKKDHENFQITSRIIQLDIRKPTREVALNLNIEFDDDVYYGKRVRYIHGETLCLEELYFNKSIITYLNNEIISESILSYIKEGLGLKVGFTDTFLHVDKLTSEEAKYLGLKKDNPKLYIEFVCHLTNGQAFNFSKVTYNYERSQFAIQMNSYYF